MKESGKREEIGKGNEEETARRRTQGPLKITAREGTPKIRKSSQSKEPRTFEENSQGNEPTTFEGRVHRVERWRVQDKRK